MPNKDVERYAFEHDISFRQAKKRMKRKKDQKPDIIVQRGQAVPGTGKPKGAKK